MRSALLLLVLICSMFICSKPSLRAVGAFPHPVRCIQPDGSVLTLLLHGDECFKYRTTLSGEPVVQAADGFYYHADFGSGGMTPSSVRVSPSRIFSAGLSPGEERPELLALRERAWNRWRRPYGTAPVRTVSRDLSRIRALVIPVEFDDVRFSVTDPESHFHWLLNGQSDALPSAVSYFRANLGEDTEIRFDVTEPVRLSGPMFRYGANSVETTDLGIREMVVEACLLADGAGMDFAQYDGGGDGTVDYLLFCYAGYNEAEGGPEQSIWPHSWTVADAGLVLDGVQIGAYACTSELRGNTGAEPAGIGTFCHEFGHLLGLMDLYDTDGKAEGTARGLWRTLSLMDMGCYNDGGNTPPYFSAVELDQLGIARYEDLIPDRNYAFAPPVSSGGRVARVRTADPEEYFLMERRTPEGWDRYIGSGGMLVYHIDRSRNVAGAMQASVRWQVNRVNACAAHECADLVEAFSRPQGVTDVFFPGQHRVRELHTGTRPPLVDWFGRGCGIGLEDIWLDMDSVYFHTFRDAGNRLPKVVGHEAVSWQTDVELFWEPDYAFDTDWRVEWKSVAEAVFHSVTVPGNTYVARNLIPGESYLVKLTAVGSGLTGETYVFEVRTLPVGLPYPVIAVTDREWRAGDSFPLRIQNLTESCDVIRWFVDGKRISGDRYVFPAPGPVTVRAEIVYTSDRSVETIERTLHILPEGGGGDAE